MTTEETGAFVIWLMVIVVVAVILDGGWIAGTLMAIAGILIGLMAVRRRRANRQT